MTTSKGFDKSDISLPGDNRYVFLCLGTQGFYETWVKTKYKMHIQ